MDASPTGLCPRCHRDLTVGLAGGKLAHACLLCGGVWLPSAVSTRVLERLAPAALETAEEAAHRASVSRGVSAATRCPSCQEEMTRVGAAGVAVDLCATHGTWFDRNEIQQLAAQLQKGSESVDLQPMPSLGAGMALAGGAVAAAGLAAGPSLAEPASNLASTVGEVVVGAVAEGAVEVGAEAIFGLIGSVLEGVFS